LVIVQHAIRANMKRFFRKVHSEERGITAIETAIITIAFVVVASVFAYSVLSAGMFSTQSSQEAIYSALEDAMSTLTIKGNVVAKSSNGSNITSLLITLAPALSGEAIDLTPPNDVDRDGVADSGSPNVTVISFHNERRRTEDLAWSRVGLGNSDNDTILESGEKHEITIDMTGVGEAITTTEEFTIEIKPPNGSAIKINRVTPASLDKVMILY